MSRLLSALVLSPLALAAAACSDPPPTPAAMGISINLTPPSATEVTTVDISGRSCTAEGSGSATYSIGQPSPNKTIENGKGGVTVDCTVRADGSFSAEAAGLETITKQRLSLNVSGRITNAAAQKDAGTGAFQFYTPGTGALYTTSPYPDCTFGPVTTLKKGAILADINCPIIIGENPQDGCKAKGTIAFEYCKTGEEED